MFLGYIVNGGFAMKTVLEQLENRRLLSASATAMISFNTASTVTGQLTIKNGTVITGGTFLIDTGAVRITKSGTLLIDGTTGKDEIKVQAAAVTSPSLVPITGGAVTVISGSFSGASISPVRANEIIVRRTFNGQSIIQNFSKKDVKRIQVEA